jgi:hypothetical protein
MAFWYNSRVSCAKENGPRGIETARELRGWAALPRRFFFPLSTPSGLERRRVAGGAKIVTARSYRMSIVP